MTSPNGQVFAFIRSVGKTAAQSPGSCTHSSADNQALTRPNAVLRTASASMLVSALVFASAAHAQIMSTLAGNGTAAYSGDGGAATAASISGPIDTVVDANGNVFFSDYFNHRIRKITPGGIITTVAGTGTAGFSGDGGPATAAMIRYPNGVAIDSAGNLVFSDSNNSRIRRVSSTGVITTIAGNGTAGYSGDGGAATSAAMQYPYDFAYDANGNLFIADTMNNRIRKVTTSGVISTVAGTGTQGFSGDGGPATNAMLNQPADIAFDASGNLYVSDSYNNRVRKITPGGIITTFAGNGTTHSTYDSSVGDGALAYMPGINNPGGLAFDPCGNLYIADFWGQRIRKVNLAGNISTVAGNGTVGFGGDGAPALSSILNYPHGVTLDTAGNLYIADRGNNRLRKVTQQHCDMTPPQITPIVVGTLGNGGWYRGTVTVGWDVYDGESTASSFIGCGNVTLPANTAGTSLTCSATSGGGTASKTSTFKVDSTAPTLNPVVTPNPLTLGAVGTATANATDALSGVSTQSCGALNTASIGSRSVACSAQDFAGNIGSGTAAYSVRYGFIGFKPPVDNLPTVNLARAGQTIPLKWQLVNAAGAGVTTLASITITVLGVACDSGAPLDEIEEYTVGASALLNQGGGNYQYNWQTPTIYQASCRKLTIGLGDGNAPAAMFKFK